MLIKHLSIDSRKLIEPSNTLFFALQSYRDGHQFIADAYQKGVRNFVVSDLPQSSNYPNANWIVVPDTLKALQKLASWYRHQFNLTVIGITGSNGKTVVKEWLYQLIGSDYHIVRSPKSYNSQIGVPLSLWQIRSWHNLGIFEAGISKTDEMEAIAALIDPKIGVLTNIGEAHNEGFENKWAKLDEKIKLFKHTEFVVCPYELGDLLKSKLKAKVFTWGKHANTDLCAVIQQKEQGSVVKLSYGQQNANMQFDYMDMAAIQNALSCTAVMLVLGYDLTDILNRIKHLSKIEMRLQLVNGINRCSLIDDSYSADLASLTMALDFLNQQNQHHKRCLILSDLVETGKEEGQLYAEIAQLLKEKQLNKLIGVGEQLLAHQHLFDLETYFFAKTSDLIAALPQLGLHDETILVKGARKFAFEQIVKKLSAKAHETVLEINLNALLDNLQYYRSQLKPDTKIMAMVKAFSYGSGSYEIANVLQYHKVDYLAVAYADEGLDLRKAGIELPIMVMSPEPSAFEAMLAYQLEPEIYSLELLQEFLSVLPADTIDFPIHLKIDTGMHRLGFEAQHWTVLAEQLVQDNRIKIKSIFSHLVASEDTQQDEFTLTQIRVFETAYQQICSILGYQPLRHLLNTSGITRWGAYQYDMVRLGLGLQGFDSAIPATSTLLKPIATLRTSITQIKELAAYETVGYGRRGMLPKGGKLATVKIGYADGYSRAFGNGKGQMLIQNKRVHTVGSICMDMCMLDVSGLDVQVGDEVIVFNEQLRVDELAALIGTIPYELLTSISQRVKRVYFYE